MSVKLLTEQYFEFLSLTRGFTDSSESTLAKMPRCWKSHVAAQMLFAFSYECKLVECIANNMNPDQAAPESDQGLYCLHH